MSWVTKMSDEDDILEGLFAEARTEMMRPSDDLMARVMADAIDAMPNASAPAAPRHSGGFLALIGGWPALAGLATATVAGVWIGFAAPDAVTDYALGVSYDVSALAPGYGELLGESTGFGLGDGDG